MLGCERAVHAGPGQDVASAGPGVDPSHQRPHRLGRQAHRQALTHRVPGVAGAWLLGATWVPPVSLVRGFWVPLQLRLQFGGGCVAFGCYCNCDCSSGGLNLMCVHRMEGNSAYIPWPRPHTKQQRFNALPCFPVAKRRLCLALLQSFWQVGNWAAEAKKWLHGRLPVLALTEPGRDEAAAAITGFLRCGSSHRVGEAALRCCVCANVLVRCARPQHRQSWVAPHDHLPAPHRNWGGARPQPPRRFSY
jgi:hypothetical protein